jgi:hypothetical protein
VRFPCQQEINPVSAGIAQFGKPAKTNEATLLVMLP